MNLYKKTTFLTVIYSFMLASCVSAAAPSAQTGPTSTVAPVSTATASITLTPTPEFATGEKIISEKDGMTQFSVPNGEFPMGTSKDGEWVGEEEMPQHIVYLDGYWMDEAEVTNSQYAKCVDEAGCTPPHKNNSYTRPEYYGVAEFDNFPVIQVDWTQAKAYCEWAGRRLPTEAEWEKAARGTSERTYPWPVDSWGFSFANFSIYNLGDTTVVKHYLSGVSPYGLFDMAGNVYEWVADWYSETYYANSPSINPPGPETGIARVMRGGAWSSDWIFVRTASRMHYYPEDFSGDIGFRCAQSQ